MKAYLVIDIGTSSMRGIVYDELYSEISRVTVKTQPLYHGDVVEQEVSSWDDGIDEILKGIATIINGKSVLLSGVFLTSQRSSLICLDKNFKPLTPAIMWQDKRANKVIKKYVDKEELFIDRTGSRLNPVYLGSKIIYIKEEFPEVYEATYKFASIADYIRYKMTGKLATDYSYASRTSLFNIYNNNWDETILSMMGIDERKLCEIEPVGKTGNSVLLEISRKYHLGNEVPFISCGGDQQCSAVGMGLFKPGTLSLTLGSGGFLLSPTNNVVMSNVINFNYHSIPEMYLAEGIIISVASLINYFYRTFYFDLEEQEFYKLISDILNENKYTDVIHFPYYQGRGTPDWNNEAKGAYFNLTFATNREEMLLSVIESIGFEISKNISKFEQILGLSIKQINVAGGIANNNQIIQLLSDITGYKFIKMGNTDSTALGALLVGLNALDKDFNIEHSFENIFKDYNTSFFSPRKKNVNYYNRKMSEWDRLYSTIYG